MNILITWQPEIAEAGHYFLTIVQHDDASDLPGIMAKAFAAEDLDPALTYDLCSVVAVECTPTIVV